MSDFARGVVGVLAVGMIAGVGALLLIPQPSPSAMRFAEPAAKPCSQQTWPETDRICQKWTAPQRAGAHKQDGAAAEPSPAQADTQPVVQAESAPGARPARATASRSAQNARAAQHRKPEGLQMMRGFGDNLSDVPASAYAPDGTRRTIGRATSRHNANHEPSAAQRNRLFPLFR
jgi:hypothetical protein